MTNTDSSQSLDDLLGGGPPAFKFETVGDTAKGIVLGAQNQQVTDIKTNEPLFYNDGNPRTQLVVTLRLDDGNETRVFCKPAAKEAIREAVKSAGASFEVGGRLAVKYTGDEPSKQAGMSPRKLFSAQYAAPAPQTVNADDLL